MVKRMLVDTNHPEETRVVVIDGTRLEAFDLETSTKQQNKGNIYLAKVVRVEPSLQAAFVDYGGNRHGFLAFSEIHPDYYQIPVADREALIEEAKAHDKAMAAEDGDPTPPSEETANGVNPESISKLSTDVANDKPKTNEVDSHGEETDQSTIALISAPVILADNVKTKGATPENDSKEKTDVELDNANSPQVIKTEIIAGQSSDISQESGKVDESEAAEKSETADRRRPGVEEVGGEDETEENLDKQRRKFVASRRYKIQEVIKRKQILLIQVVKEERGNKGAALTTYLSLAGRYCVLMPNSARGGGVSRKITNANDRRRLKSIVSELKISEHMAVILRTAGAERSKAEVKRDYEYLQRTWNHIRELTMESRAPARIHEEANLIKRSIRDVYSKDIAEILVEGEEGYKAAKEFMKTLTPSHAKKVQRYNEQTPLFQRYQIESQLDAMHSPTTKLKSGGSIVFGQTEALVAIDVNSGSSTKERHIEETALKTNLEAADEIARQLRLRDLAGLVVIDFIDMDEHRNNHAVERQLKEALKSDRARIQVGRISHFGLLELSRQRLRPSLIEANFSVCKACTGTGMIRSIESTSVHTLRSIEEEGLRNRTAELTVTVHPDVALYILNYKRTGLEDIQTRYDMKVFVLGDSELVPPDIRMERIKGDSSKRIEAAALIENTTNTGGFETEEEPESTGEEGGRKRRRRKRKRNRPEGEESTPQPLEKTTSSAEGIVDPNTRKNDDTNEQSDGEDTQKKGRRRGRRGGRRRRNPGEEKSADGSPVSDSTPVSAENGGAQNTPVVSKGIPSAETSNSKKSENAPATDPSTKTSSRLLEVFKKGAKAIRSSVSESGEAKQPTSGAKVSPLATRKEPAVQTSEPKNNAKLPVVNIPTVVPSGSPKKGWWSGEP
jgi:ribonuclease E